MHNEYHVSRLSSRPHQFQTLLFLSLSISVIHVPRTLIYLLIHVPLILIYMFNEPPYELPPSAPDPSVIENAMLNLLMQLP